MSDTIRVAMAFADDEPHCGDSDCKPCNERMWSRIESEATADDDEEATQ
jgi:hypothetical protein